MHDFRKVGQASESKRPSSSKRFYAEDVSKRPLNLLAGRSSKDPILEQERECTFELDSRRSIAHSDSIQIERALTGVIDRVNKAINKPPLSTPKRQNKENQPRYEPKTGNSNDILCPFGSTLSFSDVNLGIKHSKTTHSNSSSKNMTAGYSHDRFEAQKVALSEAKPNIQKNYDHIEERFLKVISKPGPELVNMGKVSTETQHLRNENGSRKSIDLHRHGESFSKNESANTRDLSNRPIPRLSSSQGSTDVSLKLPSQPPHHQSVSQQSKKADIVSKSRDSTSFSILSTLQEKPQAHKLGQQYTEQPKDEAFTEIKLEELCTRLKFVFKKDFTGLQTPISILNEALMSNAEARAIVQAAGPQADTAMDRLELAFHKAGMIHQQNSSEVDPFDMITVATISTLKNCAKDLMLTLKAYSGISCSSLGLNSTVKDTPTSPQKPIGDHGRKANFYEADDGFESQNFRLAKVKEKKSSHEDHSGLKRFNLNEFHDDGRASDFHFTKVDEQNFGFKVHSLARCAKRVFVGFEDGAITELKMDPLRGLSLVKCYRFKGESVTEMLVVESGDLMGSQSLLAAYGVIDPKIIVVNLHTGKQTHELGGHAQFISRMVKITDTCVASCSFDRCLKIWDLRAGSCIFTQVLHDSPLITCTYSPSTTLLATGDLSGNIVLSSITFYQGGTFKNCETYLKFGGSGPILELCFDIHNKILCFEGSSLRIYDCRGTLFKELKCPYFVSSAFFIDPQTILLVDTAGTPYLLDFEQALSDSCLPRPATSDQVSEAELASLMISQRVTGSVPRGQLLRLPDGTKQVFSAYGKQVKVHSLINN
jgi:WD40 repeat protein